MLCREQTVCEGNTFPASETCRCPYMQMPASLHAHSLNLSAVAIWSALAVPHCTAASHYALLREHAATQCLCLRQLT